VTAPRRRVLVLADDLMVRSRLEAAAPTDVELRFASSAADFEAALTPLPDLVLVGLAATRQRWPELIELARQRAEAAVLPILAFGPHRDLDLRVRALAAGANRVLANSALMSALPAILAGTDPPPDSSD
jgi:DNA-binding response OmpR family regulator